MFSWVLMPCWFVTLAFLATLSVKVVAAATPTSSAVTKPAAAMATSPVVFSLMFFNGVLPGGRGSLPERTPLEAVSSRRSTVPARRESRPGLPDREFGHRDGAEVVRDSHMAHLGVNQPVPGRSVQQQPCPDTRPHGEVAKAGGATPGAPSVLADRRRGHVRVEADRHPEPLGDHGGHRRVLPA